MINEEDKTYADRFCDAIDLYIANLFEEGNALLHDFDKGVAKSAEEMGDDPDKLVVMNIVRQSRSQIEEVFIADRRTLEDLKRKVRFSYENLRATSEFTKATLDKLNKGFG